MEVREHQRRGHRQRHDAVSRRRRGRGASRARCATLRAPALPGWKSAPSSLTRARCGPLWCRVTRSGLRVAILASRAVDVAVTAWLRHGHRLTRLASFYETESQITKPHSVITLHLPSRRLDGMSGRHVRPAVRGRGRGRTSTHGDADRAPRVTDGVLPHALQDTRDPRPVRQAAACRDGECSCRAPRRSLCRGIGHGRRRSCHRDSVRGACARPHHDHHRDDPAACRSSGDPHIAHHHQPAHRRCAAAGGDNDHGELAADGCSGDPYSDPHSDDAARHPAMHGCGSGRRNRIERSGGGVVTLDGDVRVVAGRGGLPCGTPATAVPAAGATMNTGGVVTGDAAGQTDPGPSQSSLAPSMGGGATAPAKTPTPLSTGSEPAQPARTQTPRAPHGGGSGVRLLTRFPARNAGTARALRAGSRPKATQWGRHASSTAHSPHRSGGATAGAGNPLVRHVAGASAPRSPAPAPAHDPTLREPSAASSLEVSPAHGVRRSHEGSSPAVFAAPQPDVFPAAHGGRPTRGVGVVAPGGSGAPSSLMVRIGFARVAASWLAGVTGEAIHLQFPVTHRLERPG